jgi:hypothetical protein
MAAVESMTAIRPSQVDAPEEALHGHLNLVHVNEVDEGNHFARAEQRRYS